MCRQKWMVDQTVQPPPDASTATKRKVSSNIPLISLGNLSINAPNPIRRHSPSRVETSSPESDSGPSTLAPPVTPPPPEPSTQSLPSYQYDENYGMDVYNTDSIKALRDVELAVDRNVLSKMGLDPHRSHMLAAGPRISSRENPFTEIAPRLGSRRIRPLVLELVQALGHYIDAVWHLTFPDRPCPWVHALHNRSPHWTSKVVTAVQEGKRTGHVADPPTQTDLSFWQEEIRHSLRDVDDAVGIYKGVGWAFRRALLSGAYQEVNTLSVIGSDGTGGDTVRLLNDLEESLW